MAVTVKTVWMSKPFEWHTDKDGSHVLMWSSDLYVLIEKGENEATYRFSFRGRDSVSGQAGFKCDGLSVPKAFRWFLKSWDDKKPLYNLAGALHDWLYATLGAYNIFTRTECDDIFRGILRESGVGRFKAGAADLAVGIFAGNRRHWGSDSYKVGELVHLSVFV